MEPENAKRLHVLKLCKKYRAGSVEPLDMLPAKLHEHLGLERFDDGTPLLKHHIATIVNYCYYRGDPATIGRIMAKHGI